LNNFNKGLTNLNINLNLNFKINIPLLGKKKEENKVDNFNKYNKIIMAKLMSVSYNLVQSVTSADTLNKALYNIFLFYKLSKENKKTIIDMLNFQIIAEGFDFLKIDEDLLLNNDFHNFRNKEKNNKDDNNENKDDDNENQEKENQENIENKQNELLEEMYGDDVLNINEIINGNKNEDIKENEVIKEKEEKKENDDVTKEKEEQKENDDVIKENEIKTNTIEENEIKEDS